MKIGTKLFVSFFAVIVIFTIGLGIVFFQIKGIQENVGEMDRRSERVWELSEIRSLHRAKTSQLLDYTLNPNKEFIDNYMERVQVQDELFTKIESYMRTEQKMSYAKVIEANEIFNGFPKEVSHPQEM